jgi:ABC-type transport system involved in multi-copper enzyme maturation permease subunit
VLLILFSLLTLVAFLNRPDGAVVQLSLLCPVALLLAVAIGAGHFAREKERRGFEMLLSAPVSAARIVGAKLLAGVLGAEVLVLGVLIAIGFGSLMLGPAPSDVVLTVASFLLFAYVLASALSLRSRTYRSAFMGAASVVVFILIGIPLIVGLLESTPLTEHPLFLFAVHVLHPLMLLSSGRKSGFSDLLLPAHLALYGTATAALAADMIFRFRRLAEQR